MTSCARLRSQAVAWQGTGSVMVRLGDVSVQPYTQLDGFKLRALRSEAPAQRHLYMTEWYSLSVAAASPLGLTLLVGHQTWPLVSPRTQALTCPRSQALT